MQVFDGPRARPGDYLYTPARVGTDTVRFILENGAGRQVDVTFTIDASRYEGGALDRIDAPAFVGIDEPAGELAAWLPAAPVSAILAGGVSVTLGDLPGKAVGNTNGEGQSASITLDNDAAGHG